MNDRELADPGLVICTLLCYLGIPPSALKTGVELLIRAVSEQYAEAYGVARGQKEFRAWKDKFLPFTATKGMKAVFEFSALGKISIVPVAKLSPKAKILQKRLQQYLISKGARLGAQKVAAQTLRRVVLIVDLGFAAGCLAKCTAEGYVRAVMLTTKIMANGMVVALDVIEGLGKAAGEIGFAVFIRPIFVARATFDQSNWIVSGLPDGLSRDINFTFGFLWGTKVRNMKPDQFAEYAGLSMTAAGVPRQLLRDMSSGLADASPPKHGPAGIFFPPEILEAEAKRQKMVNISNIESLKIYEFIRFLIESGFLRFKVSPEVIADRQLGRTPSAE